MKNIYILIGLALISLNPPSTFAAPSTSIPKKICVRTSDGTLSLRARCKTGETAISNRSSLVGAQGATGAAGLAGATGSTGATGATGSTGTTGPTGADGASRIYGDESGGDLNITGVSSFSANNSQYDDVTITSSGNLSVPAGTILRINGNFINEGTITVGSGPVGGRMQVSAIGVPLSVPAMLPAHSGIALGGAQSPQFGDNSATRYGGYGGTGIGLIGIEPLRLISSLGGGAGSGGFAISGNGGNGGGSFYIIVKGTISNSGIITALGQDATSGGGGGGGIVILASGTSISHSGTISVNGGDGSDSSSSAGFGGGGGGGLVRLIAPSISNAGTVTFAGGSAGGAGTAVTNSIRSGGGGGGGSVGNGGIGTDVFANNAEPGADPGSDGALVTTLSDPAAFF